MNPTTMGNYESQTWNLCFCFHPKLSLCTNLEFCIKHLRIKFPSHVFNRTKWSLPGKLKIKVAAIREETVAFFSITNDLVSPITQTKNAINGHVILRL